MTTGRIATPTCTGRSHTRLVTADWQSNGNAEAPA